ncbi:type VII secretion-associated serine protease mycosin [Actinoplanes sp. NEAU-A12]|uniref:Type VII secretion-associated serine protease mycosin n=1 Tax=Actinoplanes sandaracinus TaxID=3045177 RepID=A0ABT6WZ10_9ACTN|nr:type VII secretion-associated serine protease mycosin [Actinoplanes sandaracinus]MDI6104986.1 type VII secretion-associated serine protease mycosin [Actinoplanes sandaracinus]
MVGTPRRSAVLSRGGQRIGAAALAGLIAFSAPATAATAAPARPLTGPVSVLTEPSISGDTVRADQWHLNALRLTEAWNYANGAGVTVAVLDSGVDAHHLDLEGQVLPGLDLVDKQGDGESDPVGHGTSVSAFIAGRNDDQAGVVGIAPKAKILPVRVLDNKNRYDDALIVAKGVRWAVDNGADVINLSLGGSGASATLAAAIDYAFAKDVVVIACTGNASGTSTQKTTNVGVWYPAREPGVIAVGGTERDGEGLWTGSMRGSETVVTAPATDLVGARPDGYWRVQGTSFASPMVAGTAALIRSRWPDMPASEVVNRIIRTAQDRGAPGRDAEFGFGLVDPVGALTADVTYAADNPLDNTPSPGVAKFGSAPSPGQAQSAPEESTKPDGDASPVPGGNTGAWATPVDPAPTGVPTARWIAILLFLLSAAAAAITIRRFAATAG